MKLYKSAIKVVFDPDRQSVPKIACGPTKKNIEAVKNSTKNIRIPNEYKPNKNGFPFLLFFPPFNDPYNPAIPRSKNTILRIYNITSAPLTNP